MCNLINTYIHTYIHTYIYTQVRDEGTIAIAKARHPVLLLRGKQPVGNDMALDGNMQALVLTGPNAGKVKLALIVTSVI